MAAILHTRYNNIASRAQFEAYLLADLLQTL